MEGVFWCHLRRGESKSILPGRAGSRIGRRVPLPERCESRHPCGREGRGNCAAAPVPYFGWLGMTYQRASRDFFFQGDKAKHEEYGGLALKAFDEAVRREKDPQRTAEF